MKAKIKGIIFDVGGVLVTEVSDVCLKEAAKKIGISLVGLRAAIAKGEIEDLQTGKEAAVDFWQKICRRFNVPCPSKGILANLWKEPYVNNRKKKTDIIQLARKLKQYYRVAILSNTIYDHACDNAKQGIYEGFDPVILSHQVGLRKPQKEIFILTAERMGISPENILFIDDSFCYVKAAREAGLNAVRFINAAQLKRKLKLFGITV